MSVSDFEEYKAWKKLQESNKKPNGSATSNGQKARKEPRRSQSVVSMPSSESDSESGSESDSDATQILQPDPITTKKNKNKQEKKQSTNKRKKSKPPGQEHPGLYPPFPSDFGVVAANGGGPTKKHKKVKKEVDPTKPKKALSPAVNLWSQCVSEARKSMDIKPPIRKGTDAYDAIKKLFDVRLVELKKNQAKEKEAAEASVATG